MISLQYNVLDPLDYRHWPLSSNHQFSSISKLYCSLRHAAL